MFLRLKFALKLIRNNLRKIYSRCIMPSSQIVERYGNRKKTKSDTNNKDVRTNCWVYENQCHVYKKKYHAVLKLSWSPLLSQDSIDFTSAWRSHEYHPWRNIPLYSFARRLSDLWLWTQSICNRAAHSWRRRTSSADTRAGYACTDSRGSCRGRIFCFSCCRRAAVWRPRRSRRRPTTDW